MDENPVQSLGFINRLKNRLSQVNQRTALDAFLILLIVVGIIATVFLAGQRQIFRSGASSNGSAEVVNEQGQRIDPDENGNTVVETQQIRLKIEFPTEWSQSQGLLPSSLFSPAYAQQISCGTPWTDYSGQVRTTVCSEKAQESEMPGCTYLSGYKCSDQSLPNCWACPAQQSAPAPTAAPTQPPAQQSCPGQCASPKDQTSAVTINGSTCTSYLGNSAYDTNCRSKNTGYDWCYTSCAQPTAVPTRPPAATQPTATSAPVQACGGRWEGKRTECSADANRNAAGCTYLDAWSRPSQTVCSASTPFCWACPESAFGAPAQPTAPPPQNVTQPPQRAAQPPTATPVREQAQWIRVSLNEANVLNGNCYNETTKTGTGSTDPRQHCMEFSTADLIARGGLVNWGLPDELKTYIIYIGFISDKGNLKPNPLQVKVTYRPKQPERVGGPIGPQPTKEQKPSCTIDDLGVCVDSNNKTQSGNICSGSESISVLYDCTPPFEYCMRGSNITCTTPAQPTVQPTPPITTCDKLFEDCMRIYGAETPDTNKCNLMKANCESLKTGGLPPTPTPTQTSIPEPSSEQFDTSKACADQYSPCVKTLQQQGISYMEATNQCGKKRSICTDYKNSQCEKQQYAQDYERPFSLPRLAQRAWCSLSIR